MAKKKKAQEDPDLSNFSFSDFIRFIINLPKAEQQKVLELIDNIDQMSEKEREHVISNILMDTLLRDYDNEDEEDFTSDGQDEFNADLDDIENYPQFHPRPNVQKFTLRVTLKGLKPAIYRKFNVPSNITLRHLSELMLELMGWMDEHLNQFRKGDNYYAPAYQREDEMPVLFGPAKNFNQEDYTISDLLSEKGKSIEWEYDFGDSWLHEVKLSSVDDYKEGEPRISFVKGERACPPEDCGGIWGYQELLEIYEKKKSRKRITNEEKERLEWYAMLPDQFDPEDFDTDSAHETCDDFC